MTHLNFGPKFAFAIFYEVFNNHLATKLILKCMRARGWKRIVPSRVRVSAPAELGKGMLNWLGKVYKESCNNKYCHNILFFLRDHLSSVVPTAKHNKITALLFEAEQNRNLSHDNENSL